MGGHSTMIIPAGTNCIFAGNIPQDREDPVYWVESSPGMDENTKNGIDSHGILLKQSEILNGIV